MSKSSQALMEVLDRPELNGVYRLSMPEPDFKPMLDGHDLPDKQSFLAAMGRVFDFPDYYGENWDALEECLGDMSWHDGPIALLIRRADAVPASVMSIFLDVFASLAEYWADQGRACSVFLADCSDAEIPLLV